MRFSSLRRSAASKSHGQLVAARTITSAEEEEEEEVGVVMPSICVKNSVFMRREASCSSPARKRSKRRKRKEEEVRVRITVARGHQSIDLVEEDHRRSCYARTCEEAAHELLTLSAPFRDDRGGGAVEEGALTESCHRARQERLPCRKLE